MFDKSRYVDLFWINQMLVETSSNNLMASLYWLLFRASKHCMLAIQARLNDYPGCLNRLTKYDVKTIYPPLSRLKLHDGELSIQVVPGLIIIFVGFSYDLSLIHSQPEGCISKTNGRL